MWAARFAVSSLTTSFKQETLPEAVPGSIPIRSWPTSESGSPTNTISKVVNDKDFLSPDLRIEYEDGVQRAPTPGPRKLPRRDYRSPRDLPRRPKPDSICSARQARPLPSCAAFSTLRRITARIFCPMKILPIFYRGPYALWLHRGGGPFSSTWWPRIPGYFTLPAVP